MPSVRWENARLSIQQDGVDIGTIIATDFSAEDDIQTDRSKFQGRETPDIDATYNGCSGSMTLEIESGTVNVENMLDRYRRGIQRRDGTGKVTIFASQRHDNGTVVAYRYTNCQLMPNKRGTQNARFTITLRFECESQVRVA